LGSTAISAIHEQGFPRYQTLQLSPFRGKQYPNFQQGEQPDAEAKILVTCFASTN
jgi:hypothetical protein